MTFSVRIGIGPADPAESKKSLDKVRRWGIMKDGTHCTHFCKRLQCVRKNLSIFQGGKK
jgi:hypothetical protein